MFWDGVAFESARLLLAVNQHRSHMFEVMVGYMNILSYRFLTIFPGHRNGFALHHGPHLFIKQSLMTLSHLFFVLAYFHTVRILLLKGLRLWQTSHSQKMQVELRWATWVQEALIH